MQKGGAIYIIGNTKPVLYVGVTSNLIRRIYEHRNGLVHGFTKKYNIHRLLYFELYESIEDAIRREKQIKKWHRDWKINLISSVNPEQRDLYPDLLKQIPDAETSSA